MRHLLGKKRLKRQSRRLQRVMMKMPRKVWALEVSIVGWSGKKRAKCWAE